MNEIAYDSIEYDSMEQEMWQDWLMSELLDSLPRPLHAYFERQDLSTMTDMEELLYTAYQRACLESGLKPELVPHTTQLWINPDRLCKPFGALVLDALRSYHKKRWYIKTLAMRNRMCFLPGMEDLAFTMHGNIPR